MNTLLRFAGGTGLAVMFAAAPLLAPSRAPAQDAAPAAQSAQAQNGPVQELTENDVINGTMDIQFATRTQLDSSGDAGPDCDQVAKIYADAAPNAPERFGVIVQPRQGQAKCQGSYGRDGSFLGSLEK